uniref:Testis-expressed sequence 9 protein n=1 Tax=Photinus pyralis TaxID=7054 RepID=A0A1Y1MX02_PHOPY
MSSNWLEKEEEYRKLNEELQKQNKILMEEFDDVLKKQANRLQESQNVFAPQRSSFIQNKVKLFDQNAKENYGMPDNIDIANIPDSVDQMGIKAMSSFYRAKIKTLQGDNEKLQIEFKNKCQDLQKSQNDNSKQQAEKDKWFQAYNTNKITISKLENQITTLNAKCQSKEVENASLRRDIDNVKKELKHISLNVTGGEVRLNRALEENERMKNELKMTKQEEKQVKESHKKDLTELTKTLQQVEKQKNELLAAYKKQMQLVDNLKRQKLYIEAMKLGQMCENEFLRILNWKIE